MEFVTKVVECVNTFLWDYALLVLLLGAGIIYSFSLKFIQIRKFGAGMKALFGNFSLHGGKGENGLSSFQALTTAIAAQVGTGNIAGAATAIASGGPGSIFWMWVSAFFGMGTIFSEAVAAQKYKATLEDGTVIGGPAYYIKAAFKGKLGSGLANAFSIFLIVGFGLAAALIQGNTISEAFSYSLNVPPIAIGVVVAILTMIVVVGGRQRIASFVSTCVPLMSILYLAAGLIVVIVNIENLGPAIKMIFVGAFNPRAVAGGMFGVGIKEAMRYGIARGLFSNEAGTGSTPHAHAVAKVKHPCDQGIVAMMSVFIDTFIILNMTVLIILTSGAYTTGQDGIVLTQIAFSNVFGNIGHILISICIFFFSFSTIIAGYFYGQSNVLKLFGNKGVMPYNVFIAIFVLLGAGASVSLVWSICDVFNGFMVVLNILGLWGISNVVVRLWKEYQSDPDLPTTLKDVKAAKEAAKAEKT